MSSIKRRLTSEVSLIFKNMIAFGEKKAVDKQKALAEKKPFFYYYRGKIYCHKTFNNYYREAKQFISWCNENCGLRSTYRVSPEMMVAYVKAQTGGASANTIKTRIAAIAKLAEGLELKSGRDRATAFHLASKQLYSSLPKTTAKRPVYSAQQINALEQKLKDTSQHYGLVFRVHVESGCRLVELSRLSKKDLLGLVNNQTQGMVSIRGKGGRVRELLVSSETYLKVAGVLEKKEVLCSYNGYRQALRRVSESLSLGIAATHAVRRFAAQKLMGERFNHYKGQGIADSRAEKLAVGDVNVMLGHSEDRMSTTHIYLNARD